MENKTSSRFIKLDGVLQRLPGIENPYTQFVNNRTVDVSQKAVPTMGPLVDQPQNDPNRAVPTAGPLVDRLQPLSRDITVPSATPSIPTPTPSQPTPEVPPETNYMDDFNKSMLELLKKGQGMTTADLYKKRRELERATLGESGALTPEELRTLSPEQQRSIRSGKMGVYEPELDQNDYEIKKAQDSIDNFFKVFGEASKMSADFADKMVAPDSVIANAKKIIEANPDAMSTVLSGFNDKTKQAILGGLDYSAIGAANKKSTDALTAGQTQYAVSSIVGQFDAEPIVKNFNVIQEGYQFAKSLGDKTDPTSSDDQGLIYAFAKVMDPNSVVRESEYTTVQKYSQSMIQSGWANAKRMAANVAFLTPEARKQMVETVNSKYQTSLTNYQNVENEYNRRIADAKSGKISGSLTNYAQAYAAPSTGTLKSPDGLSEVSIADLTPAELEEAKVNGWK